MNDSHKTISIIIPAYNEAERLPSTLDALAEYLSKDDFIRKHIVQIYIVNDGSSDTTTTVAQEALKRGNLPGKLIGYEKNRGKGAAIRFGLENTPDSDYYYLADADLSSPWGSLTLLLSKLKANQLDGIIGSRAINPDLVNTRHLTKLLGRIGNKLITLYLGINYKDTQCGYKLFDHKLRKIAEELTLPRWGYDFELLYLYHLKNLKVAEVAIPWTYKSGSKVNLSSYLLTLKELYMVKQRH